jgi:hypothetical protein
MSDAAKRYREFLMRVADHLDEDLPPGSREAELQAAAALHRDLLHGLNRPSIPPELAEEAFLHGVYERASQGAETELGPLLAASLTPTEAPEDACWLEVHEPADMSVRVQEVLPGSAAPGWLWNRIRQDLRAVSQERQERQERQASARPSRRKFMPTRAMQLAAALILGVVGARFWIVSLNSDEESSTLAGIVFEQSSSLVIDDSLLGVR